ncbi:hypothetical protein R3P38DRAFT_3197197 [Favolaschia claudopus]|uniref:Uncharacterized protein n=1 Tax=Favolaschia claudopus TaxID=2862362 RepID=A0AAW0B3Z2_9AGAR
MSLPLHIKFSTTLHCLTLPIHAFLFTPSQLWLCPHLAAHFPSVPPLSRRLHLRTLRDAFMGMHGCFTCAYYPPSLPVAGGRGWPGEGGDIEYRREAGGARAVRCLRGSRVRGKEGAETRVKGAMGVWQRRESTSLVSVWLMPTLPPPEPFHSRSTYPPSRCTDLHRASGYAHCIEHGTQYQSRHEDSDASEGCAYQTLHAVWWCEAYETRRAAGCPLALISAEDVGGGEVYVGTTAGGECFKDSLKRGSRESMGPISFASTTTTGTQMRAGTSGVWAGYDEEYARLEVKWGHKGWVAPPHFAALPAFGSSTRFPSQASIWICEISLSPHVRDDADVPARSLEEQTPLSEIPGHLGKDDNPNRLAPTPLADGLKASLLVVETQTFHSSWTSLQYAFYHSYIHGTCYPYGASASRPTRIVNTFEHFHLEPPPADKKETMQPMAARTEKNLRILADVVGTIDTRVELVRPPRHGRASHTAPNPSSVGAPELEDELVGRLEEVELKLSNVSDVTDAHERSLSDLTDKLDVPFALSHLRDATQEQFAKARKERQELAERVESDYKNQRRDKRDYDEKMAGIRADVDQIKAALARLELAPDSRSISAAASCSVPFSPPLSLSTTRLQALPARNS